MAATIPLIPFSATRPTASPDEPHAPVILGVVLAGGEDETLCYQIFDFLKTRPPNRVRLHIIATEPGPVSLAGGLRLLPNEFLPKVTLPDLLVLSSAAGAAPDLSVLALIRRCLEEKRPVLVAGEDFPPGIAAFPLEPGQVISLRRAGDVGGWLQRQFRERERDAAGIYPNLPDP